MLIVVSINCFSQKCYSVKDNVLILGNGLVKRQIILPSESQINFKTTSFDLNLYEKPFLQKDNLEFQFEIDKQKWNGNSDWKLISVNDLTDETGGSGVEVIIQPKSLWRVSFVKAVLIHRI